MTRRTSPVAVCCSSASVSSRLRAWSSRKKPRVLDGDDGLIGEGLQEGDLLIRKGVKFETAKMDDADRDSFSHQRYRQEQSGVVYVSV